MTIIEDTMKKRNKKIIQIEYIIININKLQKYPKLKRKYQKVWIKKQKNNIFEYWNKINYTI